MQTSHREKLRQIRKFDQLITYLRDELRWPIETDDFDDLTFDYTPNEIGIDANNAAKIQEIKRLRPLVPQQPWGIFFVDFEPKRLPVVALRRILSCVTFRKRASTNYNERRAWDMDDLLFISNYGEGEERQISFAHFSKPNTPQALPTLKVLGWNNLDTPLHLDAIAQELYTHLAWPEDENDVNAWRNEWRMAFSIRHREVITTSKALSERLAELARAVRDRTRTALSIESESGPLNTLLKEFQISLVHDLDEDSFADMYAQTISYGLLSARITDPDNSTVDDIAIQIQTNPFLSELMQTFIHLGSRNNHHLGSKIDFDELGFSEVVELLDRANMEAVVRDFGDRNPQEDPVIHFYEHFLSAYDKYQKVNRGVFYTPLPVVSYIVRSVDEQLRKEFNLTDGLADTTTWGEMARRQTGVLIPEGTDPESAFVQILDPATGTGTFLVEVIDLIYKTMVNKWKERGKDKVEIEELWNEYIPKHLLPRIHGYELLMAPYTIAHLKICLKLYETGYCFQSDERVRVYLTNALEPAGDGQATLNFMPELAQEAEVVNDVKRRQRFTVVIGNPPYLVEAGRGGDWITTLMRGKEKFSGQITKSYFEVDGQPLNERNPKSLNDLYVRFFRLSQWLLEQSGLGIHGFITNHSFLGNITFRGMRWTLLETFDVLYLIDLHGDIKKKERTPSGDKDSNIFDIGQGVAISVFSKRSSKESGANLAQVWHLDCWGTRSQKYKRLATCAINGNSWVEVNAHSTRFFLFKPFDNSGAEHYEIWPSVSDIFSIKSTGITTARDALTIQLSPKDMWSVVVDVAYSDTEFIRDKYKLGKDGWGWKVALAQNDLRRTGPTENFIKPILYRLFDTHFTYYTGKSSGFLSGPRAGVMAHMLSEENIGLIVCRQQARINDSWAQVFVSPKMIERCAISNFTREGNYLMPLYLNLERGNTQSNLFSPWTKGKYNRFPNLELKIVEHFIGATGMNFVSDGQGDLRENFGPEDILAWIYSVLHSPSYRQLFDAQLKLDFPRVPLPKTALIFQELTTVGRELLALHLLESPTLSKFISTYVGHNNPEVSRVGWSNHTVWLNANITNAKEGYRATSPGTFGFQNVPEKVWNFKIGGYQVCHKWLKDRQGRTLSDEDIVHYQKIVTSLNETIRIMVEIDEIIEYHGGWPDAFCS